MGVTLWRCTGDGRKKGLRGSAERCAAHLLLPLQLSECTESQADGEEESQRHALLAITNLVSNEANHDVAVRKGLLPMLMSLTDRKSVV